MEYRFALDVADPGLHQEGDELDDASVPLQLSTPTQVNA